MTAVETLRNMAEAEIIKGHLHTARNFTIAADKGEDSATSYLKMVRMVGNAAKAIREREAKSP